MNREVRTEIPLHDPLDDTPGHRTNSPTSWWTVVRDVLLVVWIFACLSAFWIGMERHQFPERVKALLTAKYLE